MVDLHSKINKIKARIPQVDDILTALSRTIDYTYREIEKVVSDMFVRTATREALERYANIFDVKTVSRTDEQIRQQIIAKIAGTGAVNPELIQALASAFNLGETRVQEHAEGDYVVTITFIDIMGEPSNLESFKEALLEVFPAHLGISFLLLFMTWDEHDIYDKTWDEWDGLGLMWNDKEKFKSLLMLTMDDYMELVLNGKANPDREYHIRGADS